MDPNRFTLDMGLTHAEFFKTLPAAIGHLAYTRDGNVIRVDYEGRCVQFELGPQQVREIALLRMPHTPVKFNFHRFSDAQRETFMERFDLYFRRGGG